MWRGILQATLNGPNLSMASHKVIYIGIYGGVDTSPKGILYGSHGNNPTTHCILCSGMDVLKCNIYISVVWGSTSLFTVTHHQRVVTASLTKSKIMPSVKPATQGLSGFQNCLWLKKYHKFMVYEICESCMEYF